MRVLDALEQALGEGMTLGLARRERGKVSLALRSGSAVRLHSGRNLLDALAQAAQALVLDGGQWGEPDALDAESDLEAFDRATGYGEPMTMAQADLLANHKSQVPYAGYQCPGCGKPGRCSFGSCDEFEDDPPLFRRLA